MTNKKILILEDEEDLHDAYSMILRKEGFEVKAGLNGQEGVEALNGFEPDLLLLDLRMPKMSGIEFLEESDFTRKFPEAKIIVFTNYDMNEEIEESFDLGAHRYVLKASLNPKQLVRLVKNELAD